MLLFQPVLFMYAVETAASQTDASSAHNNDMKDALKLVCF